MDLTLLPELWFWILALILAIYLVTDGFDLGVGIIVLFTREEEERARLMSTIEAVWHANQTWLIILGGGLFGAFPLVYSQALPALYLPLMLLLGALTARGVGLEYHAHADDPRRFSTLFGLGSLAAVLLLGAVLGAALLGLPTPPASAAGGVAGGPPGLLAWAHGVNALGAGLGALSLACLAVVLGGGWASGKLADYRPPRVLLLAALSSLFAQAALASLLPLPALLGLPAALAALIYFAWLLMTLSRGEGVFPAAACYTATCLAAWAMAARPLLTDPRLSPESAAASPQSLTVMLWCFGLALAVSFAYNIYQYRVFKGVVGPEDTGY